MTADGSDLHVQALRRAAAALAGQDGRGIRRDVVIDLAAQGMTVTLHSGDPVLAVLRPPDGRHRAFATLTVREREVAALLADGASNPEIAEVLVITLGTVKDHVHSILAKTGLRSRAAVAATWHGQASSV
jgi:DNA-binding NarL/FixJ family response regulator